MSIVDKCSLVSSDRNRSVREDIIRLCLRMKLSNKIRYRIEYIYEKAKEKKLIHGRDPHSIVVAATYIACKESGIIQTLSDFSNTLQIHRKRLARNYRLLINKLAIRMPSNDPFPFLDLLADRCKIGEETRHQALILMKYSIKREFPAGKSPMSVAASILCIACVTSSEYRSQRSIAKEAGITEVTLRNRIKDLRNLIFSSTHSHMTILKNPRNY